MKKLLSIFAIFLLLGAVVGISGCMTEPTNSTTTTTASSTETSAQGGPPADRGVPEEGVGYEVNLSGVPVQNLSQDEIDAILYMREEEKLARDVYLTLYNVTGIPVFSNIARSEQAHMDMVKELIDRYNLTDPAEGMGIGEFTNPDIQDLYNQLVERGTQNDVEALKVGALIEEVDIKDLEEWLNRTDNEDIQMVFDTLMSGSYNHLRAFTRILSQKYGVTYSPQLLSEEEYSKIVGS